MGRGSPEETQTGIRTDSRVRLTGLGNGLDVGCVRNRESRLLPEFGDRATGGSEVIFLLRLEVKGSIRFGAGNNQVCLDINSRCLSDIPVRDANLKF